MPALADVKFEALRSLGHTGSINDMMLQWLVAKEPTAKTINDGRQLFMATSLGIAATGQWNTDWFAYLRGQLYTGSLNDMELEFWTDQIVP